LRKVDRSDVSVPDEGPVKSGAGQIASAAVVKVPVADEMFFITHKGPYGRSTDLRRCAFHRPDSHFIEPSLEIQILRPGRAPQGEVRRVAMSAEAVGIRVFSYQHPIEVEFHAAGSRHGGHVAPTISGQIGRHLGDLWPIVDVIEELEGGVGDVVVDAHAEPLLTVGEPLRVEPVFLPAHPRLDRCLVEGRQCTARQIYEVTIAIQIESTVLIGARRRTGGEPQGDQYE